MHALEEPLSPRPRGCWYCITNLVRQGTRCGSRRRPKPTNTLLQDVQFDQQFARWDQKLTHSTPSSSQRRSRTGASSDSFCSYDGSEENYNATQTQFLFYCGYDNLTPSSAAAAARAGMKSDSIQTYTLSTVGEKIPEDELLQPRISHTMPVFFSPRNSLLSPGVSVTPRLLYGPREPQLHKITEKRTGIVLRYSE